ncbi:MAG: insulinase family protein [Clostridia bacterium]|nr:insulinase family protein [Clostridia bacterium]
MNYKKAIIKQGITLHKIDTNKFKTNLFAIFLTTKLNRENVTKNALISSILRRGTMNLPSQEEISKKMEEMYGGSFDCGLDKTGNNQVLKFYIETVNDKFIPQTKDDMLKQSLETLLDIVFNPYIENNAFKEEYLAQEKNNIKQLIEGKIDNKSRYALDRCIEEMYKGESYGLYKYGYIEDLEGITARDLYNYYQNLISNCKIDIFVSGIIDDQLDELVKNNENIKQLSERNGEFQKAELNNKKNTEPKEIIEKMDVTQGKLILGLDVNLSNEELKYDALLFNSILGGSANSKLFQNVREKANLAYVASSSYVRFKSNIFIKCGIEIENYKKALEIIKKQIEDMKNGDFTEDDIENSKKGIIASIKTIDDEQDTQITFYFGQELSNVPISINEYIKNVESVNKQNIIDIAKNVSINTIYFLRN